jgi:predicted pyridoxine 5'-phosphate oxidase superfamily flavin-nucleotide-binding protein
MGRGEPIKGDHTMTQPISDIAFTPSVKAIQERMGSRKQYERMEDRGGWAQAITTDLQDFISDRDSFYLATATANGQPYIQHRGGPKGFLKVLDDQTLAFADFVGNRQYISAGNLAENNKAFIFLMDYANRQRIKVWGTAEVVEDDPELLQQLNDPSYKGKPESVIRFHVEAWDVNCPQHINPRFDENETRRAIQDLKLRIEELERENSELKNGQLTNV